MIESFSEYVRRCCSKEWLDLMEAQARWRGRLERLGRFASGTNTDLQMEREVAEARATLDAAVDAFHAMDRPGKPIAKNEKWS